MSDKQPRDEHTQRDGETLIALGIFMVVLALPVIMGTMWAEEAMQTVVCLASGIILLGIGLGFIFRGKSTLKRTH